MLGSISSLQLVYTLLVVTGLPENAGSEEEVWFSNGPQHFQVKSGTDVTFPCTPNGTVEAVISWSWNGRLITAGPTMVLSEPRLKVVNSGRILQLYQVQLEDAGEYTCTYNLKYNPISLTHRLDVRVAPTATIHSDAKHLTRREGDRLELRCEVQGFPSPTVNWFAQLSGEMLAEGELLIIKNLDKRTQGGIECRAVNTEGSDSDTVFLDVKYKPSTSLEKRTVESPVDTMGRRETVFSCTVEANPEAKVTWYKNGLKMYRDDKGSQWSSEFQGHRQGKDGVKTHLLKIKSLQESDYGNYSCVASNNIGTSTSFYHLTGSPDQPIILSPGFSRSRSRYTLVWKVWTPYTFPILNQSILYRKIGKANGATLTDSEGTWHNLALISESKHLSQESYSMELTGLDSDCEYEVRIRSMNSQGWSPLSNVFIFKTTGQVYQPLSSLYKEGQLWSSDTSSVLELNCILLVLAYL